jgi:hypothetical protein
METCSGGSVSWFVGRGIFQARVTVMVYLRITDFFLTPLFVSSCYSTDFFYLDFLQLLL